MKQRVHKDHYEKQGLSLAKKSACVELEVGSPEYSVVHAIQDTRERLQITQTELARRTGIDQGDISKLERGTRNPSLKLLKRLAHGLGMELKIYFIPIESAQESDSQPTDQARL
ncbi:helix-turn-helix transcriptional regulator [Erysipelotrichaceae bacterium RD49]|nr:helix-turn-helix transcriptional regulator [Erysipelotrichaceae bacterium RD49]